jgi:hypothetical protein
MRPRIQKSDCRTGGSGENTIKMRSEARVMNPILFRIVIGEADTLNSEF